MPTAKPTFKLKLNLKLELQPNTMEFKQIKELVKLIHETNLTEFKMKDGDFELNVRTQKFADSKIAAAQQAQAPPQVLPVQTVAAPQIQAVAPPVVQAVAAPSANTPATAPPATEAAVGDESNYIYVKSPIVGTFYRSSSPDKPPFVKVDDSVDEKTVVCIVEAMKLFNEIEAEVTGKIVKVLVEDASPVEYDQALFLVDPNA